MQGVGPNVEARICGGWEYEAGAEEVAGESSEKGLGMYKS